MAKMHISAMFLLTTVFNSVVAIPSCDREYQVPEEPIDAKRLELFNIYITKLQIFTSLKIPCDGLLTQWRYMTPLRTFGRVHFAVFRQRQYNLNSRPVFDLVGQTFIKDEPRDWWPGSWVTATIRPISVIAGDVLGMYYDTQDRMIPCYIDDSLNEPKTFAYDFYGWAIKNNGTITGSFSALRTVPALTVTVSRQQLPQNTVWFASTISISTTELPNTKPKYPQFAELVPLPLPVTTQFNPLLRCYLSKPSVLLTNTFCISRSWRSYFDGQLGRCMPFYGCSQSTFDDHGEANNFESVEACRRSCPEMAVTVTTPITMVAAPPVIPSPSRKQFAVYHNQQVPVFGQYLPPQIHTTSTRRPPVHYGFPQISMLPAQEPQRIHQQERWPAWHVQRRQQQPIYW